MTYTLGVKSVESGTSITLIQNYGGPTATGLAWTAVPNATLVGITAQVAADVAKAIRGLNLDKANWQQVFSGTGTINVTLPDGSTYTGPAWNDISTQIDANTTSIGGKASKGANSDITSLSGLTTALSIEHGGTGGKTKADAWGALATYGTVGGSAAQGNDPRIVNALNKTGDTTSGTISSTIKGAALYKLPAGVESNGVNTLAYAAINASQYMSLDVAATSNNIITRLITWNTNPAFFSFYDNGNGVCGGSWLGGSDERYKGNIKDVTNGLAATLSCRHVTYDKQGGMREVGIISQDAERFIDCAVFDAGHTKFSNDRVIENFKVLNTAGFAAAAHGNAIVSLFELLDLALTDPESARVKIAEYKSQIQMPVPLTADQKIFGGKTLDEMPADTDFTDTDLPDSDEEQAA